MQWSAHRRWLEPEFDVITPDLPSHGTRAVILWAAWRPLVESIRIREYVGAIGDFTAPVWPVRAIMLIGLLVTLVTFLLLARADWRRAGRLAQRR